MGGAAILAGAIFFLSLAFTRGWIGPGMRVSIGVAAGALMLAGGAWFFERKERLFGHVLVATGLGALSISLLAATRLYQLIPVEAGLTAALVISAAAAMIAIRANSQVVAGYGLVAMLAAPPLLDAAPTFITVAFLGAALVGTTAISLYKSWTWLPSVAFLLSAPQVGAWLADDAPLLAGGMVLAGYWLLNAVAAGGEEFRLRRHRLSGTNTTLLLLNATFLVGTGFEWLSNNGTPEAHGLLLVTAAVAHGVLGAHFLRTGGDRHPFGLLSAGTGLAVFSMAVPVQLGGAVVPIGWAAEAAGLVWLYRERRHGYSGAAGLALGSLAVGHLMLFEYPFWRIEEGLRHATPFLNSSGGTLGFVAAAFALCAWLVPSARLRQIPATAVALLVMYALPFELSGLALLSGWAAAAVLAAGSARWVTGGAPTPIEVSTRGWTAINALSVSSWLSLALAVQHALSFEMPEWRLGVLPRVPFTDEAAAAALVLGAALVAWGYVSRERAARSIGLLTASAVLFYLMPMELELPATVVAWSALALAVGWLSRLEPARSSWYHRLAATYVGFGLITTLSAIAPIERLFVDGSLQSRLVAHPLFWSGATAALGSLAIVIGAAYASNRNHPRSRWLAALAGALVVYLLSVGVVDEFQRHVGDETSLVSLQRQAQVALSILWAGLGGLAFVLGVVRWNRLLRIGGLGLLALATTKVFLYDMASLDATYRVPSFIGLGVLLLVSSYVYQRLQPAARHATERGD